MTVTAQQLTEKRDRRTGVVLQSLCKSHHAQYKYVIKTTNIGKIHQEPRIKPR